MTEKFTHECGTPVRFENLDDMPPVVPLSPAVKAMTDDEIERRAAADPDAGNIPTGFWDMARTEEKTGSPLKTLALTEYRAQRLTDAELCQLLGFDSRPALDTFLKAHGVCLDYDINDLDQDRNALDRLGF